MFATVKPPWRHRGVRQLYRRIQEAVESETKPIYRSSIRIFDLDLLLVDLNANEARGRTVSDICVDGLCSLLLFPGNP